MRVNMHTHSVFCDGKDTPREMIETAIEKGFDILGFSGHGHSPYDDVSMSPDATAEYIRTIRSLQKEYQDRITVYLGIEQDKTCRIPSKDPYDFVIGSVHFLSKEDKHVPIDMSKDVFTSLLEEFYDGDFTAMAKAYYSEITQMKDFEEVDIIGHLDLLMKYNEDESFIRFDDPSYVTLAEQCIYTIGTSKLFEVNTGAIARGMRKSPYPAKNLLEILHSAGAGIMLNSDCHDRRYLDCAFPESLALIRACGFDCLYILKDGEFIPVDIDQFH